MAKKTALFIGFTWPEPTSTAAGNRMWQLLDFFREQEYRTVFASTAADTPFSLDLETIGTEKIPIKLNDSGFNGYIRNLDPQIVVFDRFLTEEQFGWRVAEFAPEALRILDTEDLHSLRRTREELFKKNIPFSIGAWLQNNTTKREIASIYRCDFSLIISSYEMHLLAERLKIPKNLLLHLPFMLDTLDDVTIQKWPLFEARKDFICVGNGKHAPNVDAILWLKKEIWPRIREQLPPANLHIYGAYLPESIQQMHDSKKGFHVRGWTKNLAAELQKSKISLAPLRFGAGIKGKLIDSMQSGTPSITTSIGAEGMHPNLPWNGHIADTVEELVHGAVRLYRNPLEWQKAQLNGKLIVNQLYDKRVLGQKLENTIAKIQDNLQEHRNQNFTGAMLWHHMLASTKYMSKWIEAKKAKSYPSNY